MAVSNSRVRDCDYTKVIYTMIKEGQYKEAIEILNDQLQVNPNSRAPLSLLAYCYYFAQDFISAANYYEQLATLFPEVDSYKLYYAQSLYQVCLYQEAMKVTCQIENQAYQTQITKLQCAIKYSEEDLNAAKSLIDQCPTNDSDTEVNLGCLLYKDPPETITDNQHGPYLSPHCKMGLFFPYSAEINMMFFHNDRNWKGRQAESPVAQLSKEGKYEEACTKFSNASQLEGYQPDLSYNIALCYYQMKEYLLAQNNIDIVINRGIREHPELGISMIPENIDTRSLGNTVTLHDTSLIEAFNLKAAIEYQQKNYDAAQNVLAVMPPRSERELDAVTLHNQALMNMKTHPTEGFEKLQFLIQQNIFPPETFGNLLLLYCKYEYYNLTADVLAENAHLASRYLSSYLHDFLNAVIVQQTSPEVAYHKFDEMAAQHREALRRLHKQIGEARERNDEEVSKAIIEYYDAIERYVSVLMAQAKICWDLEDYPQVEKLLHKSIEFCNDHDIWRLNVAHVLFMQENRFKDTAGFYEQIVKKNYDDILNVSAIVLANLCVSYIMTSQNEEAEELMRKIEKEEELLAYDDPTKKTFHLSIVNLVIGTLYCTKGNYDFGISRVIKSLEPYNKKLGTETWFYAKRCFLSLLENLAKQVILVKDAVLSDCLLFLTHCEAYGRNVKSVFEQPLEEVHIDTGKNTVTYEARVLKALLLELMH